MSAINPSPDYQPLNNNNMDPASYKALIDGNSQSLVRLNPFFPHALSTPSMHVAVGPGHLMIGGALTEVGGWSTGNVTTGSTSVAVTGLTAGFSGTMLVEGYYYNSPTTTGVQEVIPPNTTGTISGSTVTLSASATQTQTGVTLRFSQVFTFTAPVSNSRIDRIVINPATGIASVVTGTSGASPSAPAITAGYAPCAQVLLTSTTTSLGPSNIYDERDLSPLIASSSSRVGGSKVRNGTMDICQRGTSALSAGTGGAGNYTLDGWLVLSATAAVTVARVTSGLRTGALTQGALQITGASSAGDVKMRQRIESYMAAPMAGQQVTIQAWVYNNTGGSITPTISTNIAGSQDNYTSPTADLAATNLQACANTTWTQVSYSYKVGSTAALGLEAIFDFGSNFTTTGKTLLITEVDISVTPNAATGQVSSPVSADLRPIGTELELCQRYFNSSFGNGVTVPSSTNVGAVGGVYFASAAGRGLFIPFPVGMRASPTISTWDTATNSGKVSYYNGSGSFVSSITVTGTMVVQAAPTGFFSDPTNATTIAVAFHYTASAEL